MRLTNSLPDLHYNRRIRPPVTDPSQLHFHPTSFSSDDFLDQIFPWELHAQTDLPPQSPSPPLNPDHSAFHIGADTKTAMAMLSQQLLATANAAADSGLFPFPGNDVVEADDSSSFKSPNPIIGDGSVFPSLLNEFSGFPNASGSGHNLHQNQSQAMMGHSNSNLNLPKQSFGAPVTVNSTSPVGGGSAPLAQPRQRVRARRGQATDPHSIAERLRRERIAERMKALQELVPNANKTDKASMLDEIIDYLKFLQLQVKVLSMSRLGGATTALPSQLPPDISSQGGADSNRSNGTGGSAVAPSSDDAMTVTENQVVKLMEEDMGTAMQYLQGKGLCLMPISLATAISTATCHSRPTSPSLSALTVQSTAAFGNGTIKDSAFVSRP